jgi:DNA-binding LacI/PurR family transcriptional regulator
LQWGAIGALDEAGIAIPEDISVIGIDVISFAFLARPPLTTIRVPREQMGLVAFQGLDKMLKLKPNKGDDYVETRLIVRRSPVRHANATRIKETSWVRELRRLSGRLVQNTAVKSLSLGCY